MSNYLPQNTKHIYQLKNNLKLKSKVKKQYLKYNNKKKTKIKNKKNEFSNY